MGLGESTQPLPQVPITVRFGGLAALGGAVLADDGAGPPLRHPEAIDERGHRPSPALPG
jgi:hypothetical protein